MQNSIYAQDYFPLAVGNQWEYYFMTGTQKTIVSKYDSATAAYYITTIIKIDDATPIVSEQIIEKRGEYILQLGYRGGLLNSDWSMRVVPLMKLPLKIGIRWEANDGRKKIYEVIKKVNLYIAGINYKDIFVIKETIYDTKPYLFHLYYAPNVGLIKKTGGENDDFVILQLRSINIKKDNH